MNVIAKIMTSKQFEFNGQKYVRLGGFINGLGLFQQSVKEELIPDNLEGKEVSMDFDIGLVNFKPSLKLKKIIVNPSSEELQF